MTRSTLIGVGAALASGTAVSQDLFIYYAPVSGNTWRITAEFSSVPPSPIVQIWADASFQILGDGSPITITNYNQSYDTSLSPAQVTNGPTATFVGNANAFFGTPDATNPLFVAEFEYSGFSGALCIELIGQNSAIFDGGPFGDVRLYQDAQGDPGSLTFEALCRPPAPGTATSLAISVMLVARRRRTAGEARRG